MRFAPRPFFFFANRPSDGEDPWNGFEGAVQQFLALGADIQAFSKE